MRPDYAIIFVPYVRDSARWIEHCYVHCAIRGYPVRHVVRDWRDVVKLLLEDFHAVIVLGRRDHMPRNRLPRVEVVAEEAERQADENAGRPRRIPEDPR